MSSDCVIWSGTVNSSGYPNTSQTLERNLWRNSTPKIFGIFGPVLEPKTCKMRVANTGFEVESYDHSQDRGATKVDVVFASRARIFPGHWQ